MYIGKTREAAAMLLSPKDEITFRANLAAWAFFEAQPAGSRRLSVWRVVSAKLPATRARRLAALIAASARHLWT